MNVLIVGLGSIAKKHIGALRRIDPDVSVYALRSGRDAAPVDGVKDLYSLDEADMKMDFAIVSNPTSLHADAIRKLAELRIPLFIEKPLFESLDHRDVLEVVKRSGVHTYVACNLRFLDSIRFMHDYIASHPERRVNEANVYCGSYLPDWRPGSDYRKCYSADPGLGGGVHLDLIHELDYTCWIFGRPDSTVGLLRNVSHLGIEACDYACYTLLYPRFTATVILNYYRRDYRRRLEVLFDDDTWTVDLSKNLITDMHGKIVYKGTGSILDTYESQLRYFIESIRSGRSMDNDIDSAYDILKITLDYERSEK